MARNIGSNKKKRPAAGQGIPVSLVCAVAFLFVALVCGFSVASATGIVGSSSSETSTSAESSSAALGTTGAEEGATANEQASANPGTDSASSESNSNAQAADNAAENAGTAGGTSTTADGASGNDGASTAADEGATLATKLTSAAASAAADSSSSNDSSKKTTESDEQTLATTAASTSNSADTDTDSDSYGTDIDAVSIYPRVAIDGVWKYVGKDGKVYDSTSDAGFEAITVTKYAYRAGGNRMIIPASVLEGPLAQFGFSQDELYRADRDYSGGNVDWGNFVFGYCDSGSNQIYADVSPQLVTSDGTSSWYIFTKGRQWIHEGSDDKSLDLYYLPANRNDGAFTTPQSFFCETSRYTTNSQLIADNSFYTVSVNDGGNRIYGAGETRPSGYVMTTAGTDKASFAIKGSADDTAKWQVSYADGSAVEISDITENSDGTLTYALLNVSGPVTFTSVDYDPNKFEVTYTASLANSDKVTLGNIDASDQVIIESENATIGEDKQATLTVSVNASTDGDIYTLLAPNSDIATVYWTQRTTRKFIYSFMGWQVAGQSKVYAAGDTIDMATLKTLASKTGSVNIKSVWSANDSNTSSPHIRSANFYLNLNCEILDVDGTSTSQGAANYTEAIYATRVSGTDTFGSGGFTLLASATADSAYDVDAKIRAATTNGGTGIKPPSSWTNYTQDGVTFERLPTDEEILAKARESSSTIKIDDEVIQKTNLTTANFTVRWSTVKYDETDGWHVDGVLVAKKARLVVTKTFEGETDALEEFKTSHGYSSIDDYDSSKGFNIDVTHEATVNGETQDVTDYELLLLPESDVVSKARSGSNDRRYGYTSYDADTNTYTWEIEARQNRLYTVKEDNYYLDQDDWNNLTWYEVHNSNSTYNTNGWTEYNITTGAAVKVLAAAYPTDVPSTAWQTVGFRNAYVHKGTLAVFKNDYTTGAAMANVGFGVKQTNTEGASKLYRKTGTNEYTTDTTIVNKDASKYQEVKQAKTDANGVFYLSLAAPDDSSGYTAKYVLTEDKDDVVGYDGPDTISFSMTYEKGIADGKVTTEGGSSKVTWAKVGNNQFILNIYNRSVAYTSVTAKKEWAAGTTDPKPVTVQLWRRYGDKEEIVPAQGAGGDSALMDASGNAASNEVQLTSAGNWTFSWGNLPLFINNTSVTYFLREAWIGDPTSSDSVAYDASADKNDGYADYAVTTEDACYTDGDMPDAASLSGDALRAEYPHESSSWETDGTTTYASHVLLMINNEEVKGKISFTKMDREGQAGKPLAGATFTLYSDADCTKEIESVTTGVNGVVSFSQRPAGTYYLKETKAPKGYSFEASTVYKAVVSNGQPVITRVGDSSQTSITTITNTFGAGLNVKKIGGGDVATAAGVSGAKFKLAKVDGTGTWATAKKLTTDVNGGLTFTGLDQGTYTLTETKAPAGYEAVQDVALTFTVDTDEDTGVTSFTLEDKSVIDADAETGFVAWTDSSTDDNVAYTVTVRDKALYDLPLAGGPGVAAITAAAVTLMCAAVYLRIYGVRNTARAIADHAAAARDRLRKR